VSLSRREFIGTTAAAATTLIAGRAAGAHPAASPVAVPPSTSVARPTVIASANGLRGVARAYEMISRGSDTLDAIIEGVKIQELDPADQSVGLGGLPNENGVVQLDASCMHGPTKRAGAVACLEDIATPSMVAKAVMDHTDHILLVGAGSGGRRAAAGPTTGSSRRRQARAAGRAMRVGQAAPGSIATIRTASRSPRGRST
jgi:N4-(beta-N-acetylglucosaminyl)-L-asparaginase